jgi:hypothetical protein
MTRQNRMLLLIFTVCAAPIVLGTLAYFIIQPQNKMNYGALLQTKPLVLPVGVDADGAAITEASYRGKWWIIHSCLVSCDAELYATRQAHTMLNKERDRVSRVVIMSSAPSTELRALHPGVRWIIAPDTRAAFKPPTPEPSIYLADPLGNQVLRWPTTPDIKLLNKDLLRLMRTSRIG